MKPLLASLNLLEIHHAKNMLAAEGIRCWIKHELLARLAGEVPFTECAAELHVADAADFWRAQGILEAYRRAALQPSTPWRCTQCGEEMEGQFSACWRCGTLRR